ncbi:PIN domain-containing protein [Flavobacterium sp.]|uniref:type II toxin-antitoxin system VapC family toxin n=1 Tax=Flavobacterium sp. TaxID=239 RepID=UPI00261BAC32|nr:PIN domain-containing protein [Flavobacterium sp.]
MKVFLDTNVMLDFVGERNPFFENAQIIVNLADKGKIILYVSALSFATCSYFLTKEYGTLIAKDKLSKFKILTNIVAVDEVIVDKSLLSKFSDFEDGLQYFSALKESCTYILTRNEKDFKSSEITIMNPKEFLVYYKKNKQ